MWNPCRLNDTRTAEDSGPTENDFASRPRAGPATDCTEHWTQDYSLGSIEMCHGGVLLAGYSSCLTARPIARHVRL